MYHAIVTRNKAATRGPGVLRLYNDDDMVGEWGCITGGNEIDPGKYGGLTPPIAWVMVEQIEHRRHPQGHLMDMARIYPADDSDIEVYRNRTFSLTGWPFMIHRAGTSTGCLAIMSIDWVACRDGLNRARLANGGHLVIEVEEA